MPNKATYIEKTHALIVEMGGGAAGCIRSDLYTTIAGLVKSGRAEINNTFLADKFGMSERKIIYYLQWLCNAGYIAREVRFGRGCPPKYSVLKKGTKSVTFLDEEKVTKIVEKGTKSVTFSPFGNIEDISFNNAISKDIAENNKKNSVCVLEHAHAHTPMFGFRLFWSAYPAAREYQYEREACIKVWKTLSLRMKRELISGVQRKQFYREPKNPVFYLKQFVLPEEKGSRVADFSKAIDLKETALVDAIRELVPVGKDMYIAIWSAPEEFEQIATKIEAVLMPHVQQAREFASRFGCDKYVYRNVSCL